MAEVASAQKLFDGRSGDRAPFKAEYVSSLVASVMDTEIDKILRMKALQKHDPKAGPNVDLVSNLVDALTQEKKPNQPALDMFDETKYDKSSLKIGIVGGGIAGLYTAYVLEHLGIDYEILEANQERMGGRIYTHHFSEQKHDYYDIGAMRFPNSPIMARTFDLFKRLDMGAPNTTRTGRNVLIPYYLTGRNCPTRYNDITAKISENEKRRTQDSTGKEHQDPPDLPKRELDPFKVSTKNGGTVPVTRVSHKVTTEILNDAYDRFRQKIKAAQVLTEAAREAASSYEKAVEAGTIKKDEVTSQKIAEGIADATEARTRAYEYLMRHDKYSVRDYLAGVEGYDPDTIHWLETIDSASTWYDMAFTENVFESLAFSYNDGGDPKGTEPCFWYCVDGGTTVMVDRMQEYDATKEKNKGVNGKKIHQGKVVTKMSLDGKVGDVDRVSVTTRDYGGKHTEETRKYSAVVNTTTLGALQKIDLTGMELPYGMKAAIRILRYDTSTKVGIRFKEMWWKRPEFDITLGGVAKTDLPIRVCVYPSYNIDDSGPGVLLASYTWGQDSERIAAHISSEPQCKNADHAATNAPSRDKGLKELMIYNLARLHTLPREGEPKSEFEGRFVANKQTIADLWDTHHAWDWSKDEFACGAFALFSPGQFSTLIPHLVRPASDSRFVIVGEHASANHAWIVGALDSAFRGLKQILTRFNLTDELKQMKAEFGDVDELSQEQVAKQVIIGMLTEEQMAQLRLGRPVQAIGQVAQT